ncbi:zinc-ribbon domain-containing protein [Staphylococcus caeli]|uniref:Predicted membrane protein n=1 Tax=Staphylococcus caeli TaxID=2201815 RepID=A0A1D4NNS1_9STAP|nr:zinc ribbon domain-containing protein [Staphylococcus caeli]SCT12314.1 Predicted membrane protein [Staphylococcus caeli]SCT50914.1 Predicted membrane protein [Staphylococcus caeli]
MKYCPNCGNKVENNQSFCNKCGEKLVNVDRKINHNKYYNSQLKNKNSRNEHRNRSNSKLWMIIISIVVFIIIVLALSVGGYYLYKNVVLGNGTINIFQKDNRANQDQQQSVINVLSDEFSENFMNEDNTGGYEGFNIGMSKDDIKEKFGEPNDIVYMGIGEVEKYHNIGIYYGIDGTVSSVYVLPEGVSVSEFKQFHGDPTVETENQLVYDDNPDNGFTILINIANGEIQSIENRYQVDEDSLNNMR